MTPAAFRAAHDVSHETFERLQTYEAMLRKWNPAINLVAPSTLGHLWGRHFQDSAQIFTLAPAGAETWADLGSGGGFPGLIVAILAHGAGRKLNVSLVESDLRKATFLGAVARETAVPVNVIAERAEEVPPIGADVVSARALAPLTNLLNLAARHLAPDGLAIFPKGERHAAELTVALEDWRFSYQTYVSTTERGAAIYAIKGISRV